MLVIVEKGIRDGICHAIHQDLKANKEYMKDYDNNKEYILKLVSAIYYQFFIFRWGTDLYMSLFCICPSVHPLICPSVHCASYLRNRTFFACKMEKNSPK